MNNFNQEPLIAAEAPPRIIASNYPLPFAQRMDGRTKRPLGDAFGIMKFGVNLTELSPGAESAVLHKHSKQEEFIFIISGRPTLIRENGETELKPGSCVGFVPGGSAHKLVNKTQSQVTYLEVGDRIEGDAVAYPQDDLEARTGADGKWIFFHKNGQPYDQ